MGSKRRGAQVAAPTRTGGSKGKSAAAASGTDPAPSSRHDEHKAARMTRRELAAQRRRERGAAWMTDLAKFRTQLANLGLGIRVITGDGNCMFRSLADQLFGLEERHDMLRAKCCEYLRANADDFAPFVLVEEDGFDSFDKYVDMMARDKEWGGNTELIAMSRALEVNIVVHQLNQPRWEIVYEEAKPWRPKPRTVHISYHDGDHYNSVRLLTDMAGNSPAVQIDMESAAAVAAAAAPPAPDPGAPTSQEKIVWVSLPSDSRPPLSRVREVLESCGGDVDTAIELLMEECSAPAPAPAIPASALVPAAAPAAASPAPAAPPTGPWECEVCGFLDNGADMSACDICGVHRPSSSAAGDAAPASASADGKTAGAVEAVIPAEATATARSKRREADPSAPPRRNGPCPCGSGQVYRRCCMEKVLAAARKQKAAEAAAVEAAKAAADADDYKIRPGRRKPKSAPAEEEAPVPATSVAALRI